MIRKVGQFNNSDTQVGSCDNAWVATRKEANPVLFRGDLLSSTTHDGGNQQQEWAQQQSSSVGVTGWRPSEP